MKTGGPNTFVALFDTWRSTRGHLYQKWDNGDVEINVPPENSETVVLITIFYVSRCPLCRSHGVLNRCRWPNKTFRYRAGCSDDSCPNYIRNQAWVEDREGVIAGWRMLCAMA